MKEGELLQDGIIVPVFDKTRMEASYLGAGASEIIQLARQINVSPFYRVQLIVRIHALTIGAGQSFAFTLTNTLPSDIDPREFSASSSFLTVTINNASPSAPSLASGTQTDPGAFLKLSLTATQSVAAPANLYGEFSGVLVLRKY